MREVRLFEGDEWCDQWCRVTPLQQTLLAILTGLLIPLLLKWGGAWLDANFKKAPPPPRQMSVEDYLRLQLVMREDLLREFERCGRGVLIYATFPDAAKAWPADLLRLCDEAANVLDDGPKT